MTSSSLFDDYAPTEHVGPTTPSADPETGTPALEGLWSEPIRFGPSTIKGFPPCRCGHSEREHSILLPNGQACYRHGCICIDYTP